MKRHALAGSLLLCAWAVQAATCWTDLEHPRTADQLAVSDPRVAPMRTLARHINALVHANGEFRDLPDVRLTSRWQISGEVDAPARALWFQARDHRRPMWVGDCGVLQGADRWPAQATVIVQVNHTGDLFNGPPEIRDEQLTAWIAPKAQGEVGGHVLWFGWQLVFTASGRMPWVPVSQSEYLDFAEREIGRQRAEIEASQRKTGPGAEAVFARGLAYHARQLASVRAFRASLTPAQLAGQARLGWTGQHPDVPAERFPLLVKLDPAFPWDTQNRQRAQILRLVVMGSEPHQAAMQRVLHTLDLAAFQALVRRPAADARP